MDLLALRLQQCEHLRGLFIDLLEIEAVPRHRELPDVRIDVLEEQLGLSGLSANRDVAVETLDREEAVEDVPSLLGVLGVVVALRVVTALAGRPDRVDVEDLGVDRAVACLLYPSDAADDLPCVGLGGRRSIQKTT